MIARHPRKSLSVGSAGKEGLKGLSTTVGPLKRKLSETGPVPSSLIPLLGDAAPGDVTEAIFSRPRYGPKLPSGAVNPFSNGKTETKSFIEAGELLCETMNDGPAFWTGTSVALIKQQSELTPKWAMKSAAASFRRSAPPMALTSKIRARLVCRAWWW